MLLTSNGITSNGITSYGIGHIQHPLKGYSNKVRFSYVAAKRVLTLLHSAYKQQGTTISGVLPCHCNPKGNCNCGYQFGLCFAIKYIPKGGVTISVWWGVALYHIGVGNTANEFIGSSQFSSGACAAHYLIALAQAQYNGMGHKWLNGAYPGYHYIPIGCQTG